jgi:hypothetical protein
LGLAVSKWCNEKPERDAILRLERKLTFKNACENLIGGAKIT